MAILNKLYDREDWLRWAIAFMKHGLWLNAEFEVHEPNNNGDSIWGNAFAKADSTGHDFPCVFFAETRNIMYDPVKIRVYAGEKNRPAEEIDRFPLVGAYQLTFEARIWLRGAKHEAKQLRWKRQGMNHKRQTGVRAA